MVKRGGQRYVILEGIISWLDQNVLLTPKSELNNLFAKG